MQYINRDHQNRNKVQRSAAELIGNQRSYIAIDFK